ncbi:hypothetical protein [Streptomonospora salina]|uniref:Spore-associated protein A n=1 Tax=Streptomonospora salina TaxID=104205 RepID=A0A841E3R5_9ACTN|nr:hypothetical protein [Streptomonospora salina]MBB5997352.1 hypothetical protein [Streptomonospora salina]
MSVLRKRVRRILVALSVVALGLGLTAPPAAAHTLHSAVTSGVGCGWDGDYEVLEDKDITESGDLIGRVYLLWNDSGTKSGHNCVVTRKLGEAHGAVSFTNAQLFVENGSGAQAPGRYSHYSAASEWARGNCVQYSGYVRNPRTGEVGYAELLEWKYCS